MSNDRNIAFVASGQIPPSPPPASTTGPIGWLRENLFDGWSNTILTVLGVLIVLAIVPGAIQWAFIDSVWSAGSLNECREIIAAAGAESGACWAVINERFSQFIYGFYPAEERWRANLTFILLLFALVPVLADRAPFRSAGLAFSAVFPIIAYFLIWGGSFWPLVSLAAFAGALYFGFPRASAMIDEKTAPYGDAARLVATGLAVIGFTLLWWYLISPLVFGTLTDLVPGFGLAPVESRALGGFLISFIIGVTGIALSLPIGILLALGRRSGLFFIQTVCIMFIEFIRGVPLITLLFVASSVLAYMFPPGSNLDLILRVVIMVTLFASAYMAEVIRGGLAALPSGQYEAADSLGLDYWKAMRLIVLPQALKISIPNIVSTFIGLFKDTTLVVVVGLLDPIGLIQNIQASPEWNGIIWEFYIFVGLFFFVICYAMSQYSQYLERKLATDHR